MSLADREHARMHRMDPEPPGPTKISVKTIVFCVVLLFMLLTAMSPWGQSLLSHYWNLIKEAVHVRSI